MKKFCLILTALLFLLSASAISNEVVVDGFPLGVGGSVEPDFFKPYYPQLQKIADALKKNKDMIGVIVGTADGEKYNRENDARNPGLALGRAHVLRNLLVDEFGVNPAQLLIQSNDVRELGEEHRSASVRIAVMPSKETIVKEVPPQKPDTVLKERIIEKPMVSIVDNMSIRLGGGVSTSPYGGIPIITGAIFWKDILSIEAEVGHTFWDGDYYYYVDEEDLDTKRRKSGAQIIYYPFEDKNIGFIGGWTRVEEVSQQHYQYVQLSEGPILGVRVIPFENISLTGVYNPSKHRKAGFERATSENDQFMLSLTAFFDIGGDK